MSLETSFIAVLQGICPRVFPDFAPMSTAVPYVTWQQIGGDSPTYLDGSLPDKRNADIQVNVWAATRQEANALMLQIEAALCAASALQAKPDGAMRAAFTENDDRRGAEQDFSIWAAR